MTQSRERPPVSEKAESKKSLDVKREEFIFIRVFLRVHTLHLTLPSTAEIDWNVCLSGANDEPKEMGLTKVAF